MSDNQMIYFAGKPAGLAIALSRGFVFYASTAALDRIDQRTFDTLPDLRAAVRHAWRALPQTRLV